MRIAPIVAAVGATLLSLQPVKAAAPPADTGWRSRLETFAEQHFRHPAWGYAHCRRDYALARVLASEDGVVLDDDVLFAASYIHDIAAFKPWENPDPKVDHSDVGAEALGPVLLEMGFPASKLPAVRAATRTHMYYRTPDAPEAVYLHDADALDWLGAIGIARILATVDPPGSEPDLAQSIRTVESNLADVPAGVRSPAARARVPALLAEARAFLSQLRAESMNGEAL